MKPSILFLFTVICIPMLCSCSNTEYTSPDSTVATAPNTQPETEYITECISDAITENMTESSATEETASLLTSAEDIGIYDADGMGCNYIFTYGGEEFHALCEPDNWQITDSYKIDNTDDILIICQALTDIHPVPGSDGISFRTPEDMAYEWVQHNIAFQLLPVDSPLKNSAKDVDLDSNDQGKSAYQMLMERLQDN